MDEKKDIDGKILKVLEGNASEEEIEFINQWVNISKDNKFQFQKLRWVWTERSQDPRLIGHEEQKQKIWNDYSSEIQLSKKAHHNPLFQRTWLRVAVVIAIILFPSYFLYFQNSGIIENEPPQIRMMTKSNPTGQKSLVQLPDGSKVWLNSESRIIYQEQFSDSLRSITLEGEAYFDVVKDSLRPFIVTAESLTVQVLGTEFNVSAFRDDEDLSVTLVAGSVNISNSDVAENLIMTPGTGLIYTKDSNNYHKYSKDENPEMFRKTTEWRNGRLIFDGHSFEDFVTEIKRWYGVKITVKGKPPVGWRIRASFENELLTNVLDAVSYNKQFKYTINDKEVTVMFN